MQAAESGNVEQFSRLYLTDPTRLNVKDSRGRAAVHQAAARNQVAILQFIASHSGGNLFSFKKYNMHVTLMYLYLFIDLNVLDHIGNTPLHIAVENESLGAVEFLLQQ
jgi:transient receptor potential cation channel subfamily A protein 1